MEIFTYNDFFKCEDILTSEINDYIMEENIEYLYKEQNKNINNKHDKTFRKILDNKKEFIIFLNKVFELENKINEKDIEKYNSSFISEEFKNQEADVVYKIKNKEIYILVEHQTKIDYSMPLRILKYEMAIIRSSIIKNINDKIVYPAVIPIVLYTGRKKWNASINLEVENTELSKYRGLKKVKYNLVDINDYSIEKLLNEKSILTKIMVIEKSKNNKELKNNIEKIVNIVCEKNKIYDYEQKSLLFNILDYTLDNILDKNDLSKYKLKLKGEKNMLAVFDMIEEEKRNSYIDGIREGKIEGKIEGKNEGIKMLAKRMLTMKMDIDKIAKITGLDEKEIKKIK